MFFVPIVSLKIFTNSDLIQIIIFKSSSVKIVLGSLLNVLFLMIFFLQLKNTYDFKKAYQNTLLLAINNELDTFIFDNNLYKDELELFRIFCDSSMNKKSIVNRGSMVYQE